MTYRKILLPLDGSELAEEALEAAVPLARGFGAPVLLLGVLDLTAGMYDVYSEAFSPVDLRTQLEGFLDQALGRAQKKLEAQGVRVSRSLRVGVPHEEIGALAQEEGVDLIVMTTHGRRGISHFLLGSVTERVIRTAPCPVLAVPPGVATAKTG
jgi:nucleotide-binding universal stress UspA family protein